MAAYQGTYYTANFTIKDDDGNAIDITGWTFEADFRDRPDDDTELLNLTSAGGGFAIVDAANGRFEMRLTASETDSLPAGRVHFDVLRTDASPGPIWLFGARLTIRQPVTR